MPAADSSALMRSRYAAFVLHLEDYLLKSWHPETRPASMDLNGDKTKWLGLKILNQAQIDETTATVEFIARYKINGGHYWPIS